MNVYKVKDVQSPYCGGMVLVAANSKKEAIDLAYKTEYECLTDKWYLEAKLLEHLVYNKDEPSVITSEIYYE